MLETCGHSPRHYFIDERQPPGQLHGDENQKKHHDVSVGVPKKPLR